LFYKYWADNPTSTHDVINISTYSYSDYDEAIVTMNYTWVKSTGEEKTLYALKTRFVFNKSGEIKSISTIQ
jgi:hypothetical protein